MNDHTEQHDEVVSTLDRLGQQDRDAMPAELLGAIGAARSGRAPVLARLTPWLLGSAAAIAVAIPLLTPSSPPPRTPEPLALEDTIDPAWLLGDDLVALDDELAAITQDLTALNQPLDLDLIGEEG